MTTRERLETVLDGGVPDRTPLSFYSFFFGGHKLNDMQAEQRELVERGLGIVVHCDMFHIVEHGVERTSEDRTEGADRYHIDHIKTPVGDLSRMTHNGWHSEDWIKEPGDYKIWQWLVEHSEVKPAYDAYHVMREEVGDYGIVIPIIGRTPAMEMNVDIAGTETFCMDVALEVPELYDLYGAMRELFKQKIKIMAAGPGRHIKFLENLTIGMLGPDRYRDLLVSVYNDTIPVLEAADKRVMVHYDGQLRCIADQIAKAPFHAIESLTEPPEGDLFYDECRALWPDKVFWANINVELYYKAADVLERAIIEKRRRAGKRGLAFEISEDMPGNWQESIPVVLRTLEELD